MAIDCTHQRLIATRVCLNCSLFAHTRSLLLSHSNSFANGKNAIPYKFHFPAQSTQSIFEFQMKPFQSDSISLTLCTARCSIIMYIISGESARVVRYMVCMCKICIHKVNIIICNEHELRSCSFECSIEQIRENCRGNNNATRLKLKVALIYQISISMFHIPIAPHRPIGCPTTWDSYGFYENVCASMCCIILILIKLYAFIDINTISNVSAIKTIRIHFNWLIRIGCVFLYLYCNSYLWDDSNAFCFFSATQFHDN